MDEGMDTQHYIAQAGQGLEQKGRVISTVTVGSAEPWEQNGNSDEVLNENRVQVPGTENKTK